MSTIEAYAAWIAEHYPDQRSAYGTCAPATEQLTAAFPELRRARGHYVCPFWGRREHWWCVTADGAIVDPTAHQHPSAERWPGAAAGVYEELPEDAEEPIGRCMICGEYCWRGRSPGAWACSPKCEAELNAEYNIR